MTTQISNFQFPISKSERLQFIKFTKKKLKEWTDKHNLDIEVEEPIYLENVIVKLEKVIDNTIFKLYNLTREEIDLILNSL